MTDAALEHRELMVSGSIDRAILHLGAPAALSAMLQAGFLIVDAFWLGRVGAVALAAASTAGFVMWMAQVVGEGLASGSGAVLARAVGAGDAAAARRASAAGQALAVWGSLAVTGTGLALLGASFRFMGTSAEVTEAGAAYLRIILLAMPAYFVLTWISAAFRAAGDARTPLKLLALAAAINVVGDPLLIFGLGPLPRLGIVGAALATAASWLVGAVLGWRLLARKNLQPGWLDFLRPPAECGRALRVGVPLGAEGALFSLIYLFLTRITTTFGTPAVAALGVGHKLEVFNYFVCVGMGAAATTLVGQSVGSGDRVRARRAAWRALFVTAVPVGLVTMVLVRFPGAAIAVFINDHEVVAAGLTYVLLVGMSQVFMAAEVVLLGAFAGLHWTAVPAALEITLTGLRVPLAWWLVQLGWGVEAVWFAIGATTVVKGMVLIVLLAAKTATHRGRQTVQSQQTGGN